MSALEPDAAEQILEGLPPDKTLEDKFVLGLYADGSRELVGLLDLEPEKRVTARTDRYRRIGG